MDTSKFNEFLHELNTIPQTETLESELSLSEGMPDPEALIAEGYDPQYAMYSAMQVQMLMMATVLEETGSIDEYTTAVDFAFERYQPDFPPASPVTDSYFYTWLLSDMKFGDDHDNIGQLVTHMLQETGSPADVLELCKHLLATRTGIYETIGESGDRLVVRELVTDRQLLVCVPTTYLGETGDLRFVRLAPPASSNVEYHTELTTPYLLRGRSAEEWTDYLKSAMPQNVTTTSGGESTAVADRLAAVFKNDCGALPWLDFIMKGYDGFETNAIFLTGIPSDPDSLPHHASGVAAKVSASVVASAPGTAATIDVQLTQAQRRVAVDCLPEHADTFRPQTSGKKSITLPVADWQQLISLIEDGRMLLAGRNATSMRNLRTAILAALLEVELPCAHTGPGIEGRHLDQIYRLHISLKGARPPIWRRLEVPDCSLAELHAIIQAAMDWSDSHLHEFTIDGERFSIPNTYDDGWGGAAADSTDVYLSEVVGGEGFTFTYLYDFGDCWEHKIKVESVERPDPAVIYPRCVTGKRQCPPEDCGGIWGYQELIEVQSDPDHPEHEERMEWCGKIDPEEFDVDQCTQQVRSWFGVVEVRPDRAPFDPQKFDINADVFDEDGECDEAEFLAWGQHLQNAFQSSPEFQALPDADYGFVFCLMEYAKNYFGETPATMSVSDLDEVLFDIVPRKVMAEPDDADRFVRELNAFFRFIHREYNVPGARLLADYLDRRATERLRRELADTSNFGMAKSLFSQGKKSGFDMTTPEGQNQFMLAYNAGLQDVGSHTEDSEPGYDFEPVVQPIRRTEARIGRNDPCPCGSGKKYKKCCLKS